MKTSWCRSLLFCSGMAVSPVGFAFKETGRGEPSAIAAACLAQAPASSLPAIPWWPGIQSRVVFLARYLSMRLRSAVSTEPLWVALRSDWLAVQMTAAA